MRKTVYEAPNIAADFGKAMKSNETISTYSVTCVDKDEEDASDMIEDDSITERTRVGFRIAGGTVDASPYTVSVKTETSLGQKLEIIDQVTVF